MSWHIGSSVRNVSNISSSGGIRRGKRQAAASAA